MYARTNSSRRDKALAEEEVPCMPTSAVRDDGPDYVLPVGMLGLVLARQSPLHEERCRGIRLFGQQCLRRWRTQII